MSAKFLWNLGTDDGHHKANCCIVGERGLLVVEFLRCLVANLNPARSLRTRFGLAIGGIALVLSVLASLIVGHTASEQVKVSVGESLAELAYQMTDKMDRGMFERYRDLQIISTLNAIRDPNSPKSEQRALLEKLQSTYTNYAWIGFTDRQGIVRVSTGKLLEDKNVAQRPWFVAGQTEAYVGDVHEAVKLAKLLPNPTGEPLRFVDIAMPVRDLQGNLSGVLGAHLSWEWSKEVEKSLLRPLQARHQEMFIFRQNGDLLLAPSGLNIPTATQNLLAKLFRPNLNVVDRQGTNGYTIETWADGNTYITGFAHSMGYRNYPGLDWIVLVRQKTDVAFAPVWRLQHQIFSWNLTLGTLFAVLGWLVADRITKPMLAIATAAEYIRQGNTAVKIPVVEGKDETAKLSRSLHRLVSTLTRQENDLKVSNQQLQQKIYELQQAEEKFRQLAENIPEVFWIFAPNFSEILYVSPAYEQIWGQSCRSLYAISDSWLDVIHPEDRERVSARLKQNTYQPYELEYRIIKPDGQERWIWSHTFPVATATGEVYRWVGLAQDISDRKQAEVTRQALEQEREVSELKSHFIAHASHEFRTPLTAINISVELLEKFSHQATEQQKSRYFAQIKAAIGRLTQLLDNILIVSKVAAGKLQLQPTFLNLEQFCCELVEEMQLGAGENHRLQFTIQGCCTQVYLDENQLRHILANLLSNAIKYSPQGGEVKFDLICDRDTVIFYIQDSGIGIPAADRAQLFSSFYRCSNTGKLPGTGLGLTIVKNAVDLHGGSISVESEIGVGTTFKVVLPLNCSVDNEVLAAV